MFSINVDESNSFLSQKFALVQLFSFSISFQKNKTLQAHIHPHRAVGTRHVPFFSDPLYHNRLLGVGASMPDATVNAQQVESLRLTVHDHYFIKQNVNVQWGREQMYIRVDKIARRHGVIFDPYPHWEFDVVEQGVPGEVSWESSGARRGSSDIVFTPEKDALDNGCEYQVLVYRATTAFEGTLALADEPLSRKRLAYRWTFKTAFTFMPALSLSRALSGLSVQGRSRNRFDRDDSPRDRSDRDASPG